MKAIILGAGRVGCGIARYLAFTGNDITVVAQTDELLRRLGDTLDVQPIIGHVCHPRTLHQAGLLEADILIAVTSSDEMNLLACNVARQLGFSKLTVARVRSAAYVDPQTTFHPHRMAVNVVITPEQEIADALHRSTQVLGAFDVLSIHDMKIIGVRCPDQAPLLNTPLRLIPGLFQQFEWVVLCIRRHGNVMFPNSHDVLLPHDEIYFLAKNSDVSYVMENLGFPVKEAHRLLIIGAGPVGIALAERVERYDPYVNVTIIDQSPEQAEIAAQRLQRAAVLRGDVLDQEVLFEAHIPQTEMALTVTNDDKVNILAAVMAKQMGCKRALSLLNNVLYTNFVSALKVDAIVNPNNIAVSTIVRAIRQGHIQSLHSIHGVGEILEARVTETSHIVGIDMASIIIPGDINVAALIRQGRVIFMPSQMIVRVDDVLILVVRKEKVHHIEALFAPHIVHPLTS